MAFGRPMNRHPSASASRISAPLRFLALGAAVVIAGTGLGIAASAASRSRDARPATTDPITAIASHPLPVASDPGTPAGSGLPQRAGGTPPSSPPKLLGPVAPDEVVTFGLTLRMSQNGEVEAYL